MGCDNLLIPDEISVQKDISFHLSYLSVINESNYESHKKSASASGDLLGIISASADWGEFQSKRTEIYKRLSYDYDFKDNSIYYIRRLRPEIAESYVKCLTGISRSGFVVSILSVSAEVIQIKAEWIASVGGPREATFESVRIRGGSYDGEPSYPTLHDGAGAFRILNFTRDHNGLVDFYFNASVNGQDQTIFVPKFINFGSHETSQRYNIWAPHVGQDRPGIDLGGNLDNANREWGPFGKKIISAKFVRVPGEAWYWSQPPGLSIKDGNKLIVSLPVSSAADQKFKSDKGPVFTVSVKVLYEAF